MNLIQFYHIKGLHISKAPISLPPSVYYISYLYSVYDTKVRILNKQNNLLIQHKLLPSHQHWLHQENLFLDMIVLLWKIVILMIILLSPMMCGWITLLRFYDVVEPFFCVLAGGIANFIIYLWSLLYVTDVIVTEPDVSGSSLSVIMVHDVIEPSGCQVGHQGPDVVGLLLEFKFWWLHKHFIPHIWQWALAYISV